MATNTDERLEQAVASLNDLIDRIGACGLAQSVLFLEMAKLQLKLELNGVTDEEFGAFCDALENGTVESSTTRAPRTAARTPRQRPARTAAAPRPCAKRYCDAARRPPALATPAALR